MRATSLSAFNRPPEPAQLRRSSFGQDQSHTFGIEYAMRSAENGRKARQARCGLARPSCGMLPFYVNGVGCVGPLARKSDEYRAGGTSTQRDHLLRPGAVPDPKFAELWKFTAGCIAPSQIDSRETDGRRFLVCARCFGELDTLEEMCRRVICITRLRGDVIYTRVPVCSSR